MFPLPTLQFVIEAIDPRPPSLQPTYTLERQRYRPCVRCVHFDGEDPFVVDDAPFEIVSRCGDVCIRHAADMYLVFSGAPHGIVINNPPFNNTILLSGFSIDEPRTIYAQPLS